MLQKQIVRAREWSFLAVTALLTLATAAPFMGAGEYRLGMILTYPPRFFCALAAATLCLRHLRRRQATAATAAAMATAMAFVTIGWGGQTSSTPATASASVQATRSAGEASHDSSQDAVSQDAVREFTLLAFNIHNAVDNIAEFSELLEREHVDFLSLQEVPRYSRSKFIDGLPAFSIYHADESIRFEHDNRGAFASITGVRRGLLADTTSVDVETGITAYRTFATRFQIDDAKLWIVNVHSTKAFWLSDGITGVFTTADTQSRWHFKERDDLIDWLGKYPSDAVIAAGDFNAPHYASNVARLGLHSAHAEVGSGPHLTIPSRLPIWGLDHSLGNDRIVFTDYRLIDTGYSDHRAQLVRFRLLPAGGW